jgi:YD repeat-containing protein
MAWGYDELNHNARKQRTTTVYDTAGESIAGIDPLNRRSTTVYDLAGRTLANVNPLNQRTTTVYDAAGESIARIDPLARRTSATTATPSCTTWWSRGSPSRSA